MDTTVIDFSPMIAQVLMAIGSILVGLLTAAAFKLQKKFGMEVDEKSISRVREAITNGVKYGRDHLNIALKDKVSLDVKNQIAAMAATYAMSQVRPVINKLGWDEEYLERWSFSILAGEAQSAEYYAPIELGPAEGTVAP